MARWRAEARVRDIPEADLRERLTDALEALDDLAERLRVTVDSRAATWTAWLDAIDNAVGELRDEIKAAEDERDEAQGAAAHAESRLEAQLQKDRTDELDEAIRTRDEALARLAKVEPLIESYSDLLARARTFVDQAKAAGVPVKHVRAVGRRKAQQVAT